MPHLVALIFALHLGPLEALILRLAGCEVLLYPIDDKTVAVKYICPV